jgi:hypothetical protein
VIVTRLLIIVILPIGSFLLAIGTLGTLASPLCYLGSATEPSHSLRHVVQVCTVKPLAAAFVGVALAFFGFRSLKKLRLAKQVGDQEQTNG